MDATVYLQLKADTLSAELAIILKLLGEIKAASAPEPEPVVLEPEPVVLEPAPKPKPKPERAPEPGVLEPVVLEPEPVVLEPVVLEPEPVVLEPVVLEPEPVVLDLDLDEDLGLDLADLQAEHDSAHEGAASEAAAPLSPATKLEADSGFELHVLDVNAKRTVPPTQDELNSPDFQSAPLEEQPPKAAIEYAKDMFVEYQATYALGTYNPVPEYLHPLKYLPEEVQLHYLSSTHVYALRDTIEQFDTNKAIHQGVDLLMMEFLTVPFAGLHEWDWIVMGGRNIKAVAAMKEVLSEELFDMMKTVNDREIVLADFQKMAREVSNATK